MMSLPIRNVFMSCSQWLYRKQSLKSIENYSQRPFLKIFSNSRDSYGCGAKKMLRYDSRLVLNQFSSNSNAISNYQSLISVSKCLYCLSTGSTRLDQNENNNQIDNHDVQKKLKRIKILTQKIPGRLKIGVHQQVGKMVTAYAIAEEIDLERLKAGFEKNGLYKLMPLPVDADALMFQAKYPIDWNDRELIIFRKGSAVLWNFSKFESDELIKQIEIFSQNLEPVVQKEYLNYGSSRKHSRLIGGRLQINEKMKDIELVKYAYSDALSQSVLLKAIEDSVQDFSISMEKIAQDLKDGAKVGLTLSEVLQKRGELFVFRCNIHLGTDFLETPDFYWERRDLEKLYQNVYNHLLIGKRTKILNERIDLCSDLAKLIHNKLKDTKHVNLGKYIVWLILIEVGILIMEQPVKQWNFINELGSK